MFRKSKPNRTKQSSFGSRYSDNNNNNDNNSRIGSINSNKNSSRYSDHDNNHSSSSTKEQLYKFGEADTISNASSKCSTAINNSMTGSSTTTKMSLSSSSSTHNSHTTTTTTTTACVGTEAIAKMNIERNAKDFNYPKSGFVTPIEHSLLYNMLKEPKIYPRDVLIQHIHDEDYNQYIEVNTDSKYNYSSMTNTSTDNDNKNNNNQHNQISYSQLSALLALSAENYPATETNNVSDVLGKVVIKFIISYSTENELDRAVEVQELLRPVERYATNRSVSTEFKAVAALYAGYTVTVLTANPLPGLVGFAMWNAKRIEAEQQLQNIKSFQNETARRSNIETSSLLDEWDD